MLVAEPTPFGVHDFKLMVELLEEIDLPFGLVINKAGLGNEEIYQFIAEKNIQVLAEIPFSEKFATDYASGNLTENTPSEVSKAFEKTNQPPIIKKQRYERDNHFKR